MDQLLADFRHWLEDALLAGNELTHAPPGNWDADFDLAAVLAPFVALRQEVNLQTRASRTLQEQTGEALNVVRATLVALEKRDADQDERAAAKSYETLRPLLKTLVDMHDALSLARREVERMHANMRADRARTRRTPPTDPPAVNVKFPSWARWLGLDRSLEGQLAGLRQWVEEQRHDLAQPEEPDAEQTRLAGMIDSLLTGYDMSLQRVERALEQHGLELIDTVGEPFDPETMEVVEVIKEEGRAETLVIEEVRRGYFWNDRLFRFAQVRVARG